MTLTIGIIQVIILLCPLILAALAKHNERKQRLERLNEKVDKAIIAGDVDVVNTILHDGLSK